MSDGKIYTVEIISCLQPDMYWYYDKIGKQYEVRYRENVSFFWPTDMIYTTVHPTGVNRFGGKQVHEFGNILPCDCKIISEREEQNPAPLN